MTQIKVCFIFLMLLMVLQPKESIGQENKLIPRSPEAAAFAKFLNYPVSFNTGVPDISIPIHTVEVNGITIPITLSYHASGIKVNEQSTWVGLGWNLEMEPQISRSLNGNDDLLFKGYLSNSRVKSYKDVGSFLNESIFYWQALVDGEFDEQPDQFNYKLLSGNGSFMFQKYDNNQYEALAIPYKPIKINYSNVNANPTFEIKDEQGRDYLFDIREITNPGGGNSPDAYTTSWKCSRIISPSKKDTVYFSYNDYRSTFGFLFNDRVEVIDSLVPFMGNSPTPVMYNYGSGVGMALGSVYTEGIALSGVYSKQEIFSGGIGTHYGFVNIGAIDYAPLIEYNTTRNISLKEMKFRGGNIKMYSVGHNGSGSKLDSIKIFDENGSLIKMVRFYTHYTDPTRIPTEPMIEDNRFLLDSIIFSGNGLSEEKYAFEYVKPDYKVAAWTKYSDLWGYYNVPGSDPLNSELSVPRIENVSFTDLYTSVQWLQNYKVIVGGMNKEPYDHNMKFFVLKKIINPLGGKTEFEYDANKYLENGVLKDAGGLRVAKIKFFTDTAHTISSMEKIYKYGEDENGAGELKVKPGQMAYSYEQLVRGVQQGATSDAYAQQRKRTFVSRSLDDLFFANGCAVNYTTVTEYQKDMGSITGKTIYKYSKAKIFDGQVTIGNSSHYFNTNMTFNRIEIGGGGELLSTTKYTYDNGQYIWIQQDTLKYTKFLKTDSIFIGKIFRKNLYASETAYQILRSFADYVYVIYPQEVGCMLLTGQESKSRSLNNLNVTATVATNYYYDNPSHLQLTRTETIKSDGSSRSTLTTYPPDYASGTTFIDNMKVNNLVAYPVEQVSYLQRGSEKSILFGTINQYQSEGNGLTDKTYAIETNVPVNLSVFKFSNRPIGVLPPQGASAIFSMDTRYKEQLTYNSYDNRSNVLAVTSKNNMPLSYIWDYNATYPIAEATNALQSNIAYTSFEADGKGNWNYSGIVATSINPLPPTGEKYYNLTTSNTLSKTVSNGESYVVSYWRNNPAAFTVNGGTSVYKKGETINGWTYHEHIVTATSVTLTIAGTGGIDEVRLYPVSAQMKTYTYKPLIGITSKCDTDGRITHYEYTGDGKLYLIRDQYGKILKQYDYQYRAAIQ